MREQLVRGSRFALRRDRLRFNPERRMVQKLETGNWRLETGDWKLETISHAQRRSPHPVSAPALRPQLFPTSAEESPSPRCETREVPNRESAHRVAVYDAR